ncbi:phage tail protein [Streptomyces bambusae]|uniref:phage tail protein n=1 Tax=Streptomyces bambusae TaxID=1550616 RepID=UPI001CFD7A56|nr:phage tail protein [Streptomyces bambusae]MCB5164599.1 phage tail protein [Streptomyces bambusae]
MRGTVAGLVTPYPIGSYLPAVYQEDSFAQRFTGGLDDVLAPAIAVLDSLEAYADPDLAPVDFLPWLAAWLGVTVEETLPEDARRARVKHAAESFVVRGTYEGLRSALHTLTGSWLEVRDSGGVRCSDRAGGCDPAAAEPRVAVLLPQALADRREAVESLVDGAVPAHVLRSVELPDDDHVS